MARSNTPARSKSGHTKDSRPSKDSPPSYNSVMIKDEVNAMLNLIKNDRTMNHESNESRAILAVLSNNAAVESLTGSLRPSFWKTLKSWFKSNKQVDGCLIKMTTTKDLQQTIEKLEAYENLSDFSMFVSSNVSHICFHVSSESITDLKILRCVVPGKSPSKEDKLTISGASTFCGTRLDQLEGNQEHRLYLGEQGIQILVEDPSAIPGWANAAKHAASNVSLDAAKGLKTELETTEGASSATWSEWWDKYKGPAAAMLGVATATTKFAFDLSGAVGGVAIKYTATMPFITHQLQVAAVGAKFSAVVTAAGPAVLLGAATAAAVYFVPWPKFFGWLKNSIEAIFKAFKNLWGWFLAWWDGFKLWMDDAFNPSRLRQHVPRSRTSRQGRRRHRSRR